MGQDTINTTDTEEETIAIELPKVGSGFPLFENLSEKSRKLLEQAGMNKIARNQNANIAVPVVFETPNRAQPINIL